MFASNSGLNREFIVIVTSMNIAIDRREPVLTIGRAPFVAGAIVVRNHLRAIRRRQRAEQWKSLNRRLGTLHNVIRGFVQARDGEDFQAEPATARIRLT